MDFKPPVVDRPTAVQPESRSALQDHWYAAVPSARLTGAPLGATILGHDLAVFRDADGVPRALLDRCSHRGVPLSLGVVRDGVLACRHHGWRYDGSGRCVGVPSVTESAPVTADCAAPAYQAIESDGYVWVRIGHGQTPLPPPRLDGFAACHWVQGTMTFGCRWSAAVEHYLDGGHAACIESWLHPHYLHAQVRAFHDKPYEVRLTDTGMVMFAPATAASSDAIPSRALRVHFDLPNRIRYCPRGGNPLIVLQFVPTGPVTCRLEWMTRRLLRGSAQLTWTPREPCVFARDRTMLEGAQGWYDRDGGAFERSVEADSAALLARRIMALAEAGRWDTGRHALPQRRIVHLPA